MHLSFLRAFQWLGVAAGLFLLVGLNYDFKSDAGETVNAPVEDSLSQSLLGYWKMDEGTGTSTTADSSGNSNNLTMNNADAEDWQAGQIGGSSLDFNGTDEWLTVADPASGILDFADVRDFSISGWFNRDTADTLDTVVAKRNGDAAGDTGYMIWLGTDDFLNFEISDGTDQYAVASSSTYATTGWHQFVATWKDSLGMYLYVDGASVGNNTATTSSIGSLANTVAFRIGAESSTGTENPFDGKIDDVKLYSHALSANEVSRLYQTTVPGSTVDTGLVGHWTFDGNDVNWGDSSSEIKDVSGKGNHGDAAGSLATTSVAIGKLGQGLSFNGTSDYVSAPDNIIQTQSFSVSVWAKVAVNHFGTIIVGSKNGCSNNWGGFCLYTLGGSFYFDALTNGFDGLGNPAHGIGVWHHLVAIVNHESGTVSWYMDASLVESINFSDTFSSGILRIGNSPYGNPFNGSVDDVRVYNRALSVTEVVDLYTMGK